MRSGVRMRKKYIIEVEELGNENPEVYEAYFSSVYSDDVEHELTVFKMVSTTETDNMTLYSDDNEPG